MLLGNSVRFWPHVEGFAGFVAGVILYAHLRGDRVLFVLLLLLPDVSMIGFLRDARLGSLTYNLVHNWAGALAILGLGVWLEEAWLAIAGVVLVAHVGIDRAVGYGLKYPTDFKDTHLQHV